MNKDINISARRKEIKKIALSSLRNSEPIIYKKADLKISITGGGIEEFPSLHGKTSHVFETELCGEKTWLIVNEVRGRGLALYSISDSGRVLSGIKKPI